MQLIDFELRGDFITVAAGAVQVDGRDELRKTCKLRAGQVVSVSGARVRVVAVANPDAV